MPAWNLTFTWTKWNITHLKSSRATDFEAGYSWTTDSFFFILNVSRLHLLQDLKRQHAHTGHIFYIIINGIFFSFRIQHTCFSWKFFWLSLNFGSLLEFNMPRALKAIPVTNTAVLLWHYMANRECLRFVWFFPFFLNISKKILWPFSPMFFKDVPTLFFPPPN